MPHRDPAQEFKNKLIEGALGIINNEETRIKNVINQLNRVTEHVGLIPPLALLTVLLVSKHPQLGRFLNWHLQNSLILQWMREGMMCNKLATPDWKDEMMLRWQLSVYESAMMNISIKQPPSLPAELPNCANFQCVASMTS